MSDSAMLVPWASGPHQVIVSICRIHGHGKKRGRVPVASCWCPVEAFRVIHRHLELGHTYEVVVLVGKSEGSTIGPYMAYREVLALERHHAGPAAMDSLARVTVPGKPRLLWEEEEEIL